MEEIQLDVQIRNEIGRRNVKAVRLEDFVPAVVYGENKKPTTIKVDRRQYERIMRAHHGQSVVFHLNVMEGEKKLRDYAAIVKEEQLHPVQESLVHLDFQRISLKKEIEIEVQVVCKGEPIGVKRDGGSLDQPMHDLEVICLPTNIPKEISVDVSALEIGDAIHVSDIKLPANVRTEHDPEGLVASVVPPMKSEDDIAAEGEGITEPEVTEEKKAEDAKPESK
ncbi:MAG: 50S ribosomal protein L25 [Candidatus Omnitrophica bacterium]|nr:50S ribosomal protein L25 [Candidatus Omnitrophota bacterium]